MIPQVAATRDGRAGVGDKLSLLDAQIAQAARSQLVLDKTREVVSVAGAQDSQAAAEACFQYVAALPYIPEAVETFQSPETTMRVGGDCDDHVILLGGMLGCMNIGSRIVIMTDEVGEGRHVFLEVASPHGWRNADTTAVSSRAWSRGKK